MFVYLELWTTDETLTQRQLTTCLARSKPHGTAETWTLFWSDIGARRNSLFPEAAAYLAAGSYPNHAAMGQLDFSDLEFRYLGPDAALVLGQWHLKRESGDIGGVFTLVWQKFPDGWKIIHDHTSAVGAKQ